MKKILAISAIALLLFVLASASALAATAPANVLSPNGGTFTAIQQAFSRATQMQQTTVDRLEQARLQQVLALIKAHQPAEVEFAGTVAQNRATGQWTVGGLAIQRTAATVHEGSPTAGLHAHVRAQIHSDGTVEALHVRTMTHAQRASAQHHAARWRQDDHGVHLGEVEHTPSGGHVPAHQPTAEPQHTAEPEHAGPPTEHQPAQAAPQPAHHPETPAQQQPPAQPAAPQPEQHRGEGSRGDHGGGHD